MLKKIWCTIGVDRDLLWAFPSRINIIRLKQNRSAYKTFDLWRVSRGEFGVEARLQQIVARMPGHTGGDALGGEDLLQLAVSARTPLVCRLPSRMFRERVHIGVDALVLKVIAEPE